MLPPPMKAIFASNRTRRKRIDAGVRVIIGDTCTGNDANMSSRPSSSGSAATRKLLQQYRARIDNARVYDVAVVSALEHATKLSQRLDNRVLFKRADQQSVYSFKLRGAYNRMSQLTPAHRPLGAVTPPAGNPAPGVPLAT